MSETKPVKLQVLIVTFGPQGLERVAAMDLPKVDEVGYIVSCQSEPMQVPEALKRDDVSVHFTPTRGVGRNRNNALSLASAPYGIIADDDLVYHPEGLSALIAKLDSEPNVDVATLMCKFQYPRRYPAPGHDLSIPYKNYQPTSYEIAFRLDSIRKAGVRFCDMLGVGSPRFQAGEEDVLILNALRKGLHCRFYPILVCDHPNNTTGYRDARRKGVLEANGVVIALTYGISTLPRLALKAWRTGGNIIRNFFYLCSGALYARRHRGEFLN